MEKTTFSSPDDSKYIGVVKVTFCRNQTICLLKTTDKGQFLRIVFFMFLWLI